MALITYADDDAAIDRLIGALRALVAAHPSGNGRAPIPDVPDPAALRTKSVMLPRDAFLGATTMVPWREAAGRISAEMICPYPPGIPIIAPGERLTTEIVDYLEQLAAAGVMVEGPLTRAWPSSRRRRGWQARPVSAEETALARLRGFRRGVAGAHA